MLNTLEDIGGGNSRFYALVAIYNIILNLDYVVPTKNKKTKTHVHH